MVTLTVCLDSLQAIFGVQQNFSYPGSQWNQKRGIDRVVRAEHLLSKDYLPSGLPDGFFIPTDRDRDQKEEAMVIILREGALDLELQELEQFLSAYNVQIKPTVGEHTIIWGLVGDTSKIDIDGLLIHPCVKDVKRIQEPFKAANKKFHPEQTVVHIADGIDIGGGNFQVIAGPCSVETEEQITEVAKDVKASGAKLLRGGAFKPRTSPYAFQGLRAEGLELLLHAREQTGMPVVTEIMSAAHLPLFKDVDVIQVGARNMQNFELLKELGKQDKPILLKRGLANTIEEWLMSAEYIMAEGNQNIILCERGIRTFETATRNTLDLSAITVLKEKTHLPVIVDPSHATGVRRYVETMALAAVAAGADGLIIEVHNDPPKALCDGAQSLTPEQFDTTMKKVEKLRRFMETEINN